MPKFINWLLALIYLISSCGMFQPKDDSTSPDEKALLKSKAALYLDLSKSETDQDGFVLWYECDSLIFSGLYGVGGGQVNITAARDSNGMWHRRSLNQPECYNGQDGSTISRDMMLGVMWYAWREKRLDIAEELFDYGQSHDWVMGQGDISRIYFTPGLQATLAEIIYRLGGEDHYTFRNIPQVYSQNTGYAAHLDMLHILLRAEMTGSINTSARNIIEYNYQRVPGNAFYSFIHHKFSDGNQSESIQILLNQRHFPSDHLPTNENHCEFYLWQRDLGKDWEPCADKKTHSGADLLFVSKLILDP